MSQETLDIDLYWSVRSPYSYMATPRLFALHEKTNAKIRVRVVYPHAVRAREFHAARGPLWISYFKIDIVRTASYLGLPIAWPRPDPVETDPETGEAASEQPRLEHLSRLVEAAEARSAGIAYIHALTGLLWSPETEDWTAGDQLATVARQAGLDPDELERAATDEAAHFDARIEENHRAEEAAGHWGVPLMVFRGEPFFGQDRIGQLVWRLRQHGLEAPGDLGLDMETT